MGPDPYLSYVITDTVEDDVRREIRIWTNETQARFFYTYYFQEEEGEHRDITLTNELSVRCDYERCVLEAITIRMAVVMPERLGKQYMYGMDVSPGAKLYCEFGYRFDEEVDDILDATLRLRKVTVGGSTVELPNGTEEGMVPTIEIAFPFPLPDAIRRKDHDKERWERGRFQVPFLHNDGDVRHIGVRLSIGD